jgi:hypothetical protein
MYQSRALSLPLPRAYARSGATTLLVAQVFCVVTAVGLLTIPFGTFETFTSATVVWMTAGFFLALTLCSFHVSRSRGEKPWLAPLSLMMAFLCFRYGWGALVVYYWEAFPWEAIPEFRRRMYFFGGRQNLENACQLLLLGGAGFFLGLSLSSSGVASRLPAISWTVDEGKFRKCLILFTPVALFIFTVLRFYLPVRIAFSLQLFGAFTVVIITITSYWLFSAVTLSERIKWLFFVLIMCMPATLVGLATGMVGDFLTPVVAVMIGYTLARGAPPWRFLIIVLPLAFFLVFPWLALYKHMKKPGTSPTMDERLYALQELSSSMEYRRGLEMTLDRFVGRLVLSELTAIFSRFYPNTYPYEQGRTFYVEAAGLIPRVIWPDKPDFNTEVNRYSVNVGLVVEGQQTSAVFDAISEYHVNFGTAGVFFLSALHGFYIKLLCQWLISRLNHVIGASIYLTLIFMNLDFFGIGIVFISHTRVLPVWLLLFYFLSRRSRPTVSYSQARVVG